MDAVESVYLQLVKQPWLSPLLSTAPIPVRRAPVLRKLDRPHCQTEAFIFARDELAYRVPDRINSNIPTEPPVYPVFESKFRGVLTVEGPDRCWPAFFLFGITFSGYEAADIPRTDDEHDELPADTWGTALPFGGLTPQHIKFHHHSWEDGDSAGETWATSGNWHKISQTCSMQRAARPYPPDPDGTSEPTRIRFFDLVVAADGSFSMADQVYEAIQGPENFDPAGGQTLHGDRLPAPFTLRVLKAATLYWRA